MGKLAPPPLGALAAGTACGAHSLRPGLINEQIEFEIGDSSHRAVWCSPTDHSPARLPIPRREVDTFRTDALGCWSWTGESWICIERPAWASGRVEQADFEIVPRIEVQILLLDDQFALVLPSDGEQPRPLAVVRGAEVVAARAHPCFLADNRAVFPLAGRLFQSAGTAAAPFSNEGGFNDVLDPGPTGTDVVGLCESQGSFLGRRFLRRTSASAAEGSTRATRFEQPPGLGRAWSFRFVRESDGCLWTVRTFRGWRTMATQGGRRIWELRTEAARGHVSSIDMRYVGLQRRSSYSVLETQGRRLVADVPLTGATMDPTATKLMGFAGGRLIVAETRRASSSTVLADVKPLFARPAWSPDGRFATVPLQHRGQHAVAIADVKSKLVRLVLLPWIRFSAVTHS